MDFMQLLPVGTKVRVKDLRGTVTRSKWVQACNGGDIPLHTVKLTERIKRGVGRAFKWEPLAKPQTRAVNYSFIETL